MKTNFEIKTNHQEKEPILFADIEFGDDEIPQKFVCMQSHDGKDTFIASYPVSSGFRYHMNILMHFVDKFKGKYKVAHKGGGTLVRSGNKITASGTSSQLEDFDKEITKQVLKNKFPDMEIIIK